VLRFYLMPKAQNPKPKKAEREGFEPSRRLNTAYAISNPKPPVPLRAVPYSYVAYPSPKRGPLGAARTVAYRSVPAGLQYGCSKLSGRGSASLAPYSENHHGRRTLVAKSSASARAVLPAPRWN
jgi:hypothetical protein